ncbi:MAG: aminotransferase class V-fold PLP-dependent enzyme [Acetobacteraceae bacterium]
MLGSQRALFDMPRDVCWLNAAAYGPLPLASQQAGERGVARKVRPWEMQPGSADHQMERARTAAARLIHADPNDVALISSVSYGIATAGRVLPTEPGTRVLLLKDDHTSPVLEWTVRAKAQGLLLETIERPANGDWTMAVLEAINQPSRPPVGIASISSVHWADGGTLDMARIAPALRRHGAKLVVDATHHVGVMAIDVGELDPDFLVFPTYKWVLGPYGRAFLYVAKRWQDGTPIEQPSSSRRDINSESAPYMRDLRYVPNARRFDMGERDHFITLEMASVGMELVAEWGCAAVTERLSALTRRLADGLRNSGALCPDDDVRAPHILSLAFPSGMPTDLVARLARENIFVSPRLGRMRISPHVYNDEADIDRFIEVFRRLMN